MELRIKDLKKCFDIIKKIKELQKNADKNKVKIQKLKDEIKPKKEKIFSSFFPTIMFIQHLSNPIEWK